MLSTLVKDPATLSILQALAIFIFGAAGILLGKYCKEKGYSFWLCFFLCVLLQLAGILIVFLLPDIARMQAETEARQRDRDEEIAALKKRIAQLEQAQETVAAPELPEPLPKQVPAPPSPPPGTPARFPSRASESVICPRCGRRQQGNRDLCYSCKLPFVYDDETPAP